MPTKKTIKKTAKPALKKIFVLDTNVLLHDPSSPLRFAEHDVYIPFVTLEELDGKKSGNQDVNRNARAATRLLDAIVSDASGTMKNGYPLEVQSNNWATGRLFVQEKSLPFLSDEHLHKNDNMYLSVLQHLKEKATHEVILVTKDLNLRIKAKALGYAAEDFLHDHVIEDGDILYRGWRELTQEQVDSLLTDASSWKDAGVVYYTVARTDQRLNEFLKFPDGQMYRVRDLPDERTCTLASVFDYQKEKNKVTGVLARNEEQRAAFDLLMDPEIDLVALLGPAGTGKTLLALAAGLGGVKKNLYDNILFTRANTPLGQDIGFLPGTEEEKMNPWLGALYDNIEVLVESAESDVAGQAIRELAKGTLEIRAITFMRGRTFHRKLVILDEAQNLTPEQMKALITRAGEGSKIVVLGNLAQIDDPYLSETSSGLAYLVDRFKGWPHFGALVLDKGERSRLANAGNERL